jgi:hypothetical protein
MRRLGLQDIITWKIRARRQATQAFRALCQCFTFNDATANEGRFVIRKQNRWWRLSLVFIKITYTAKLLFPARRLLLS